MRLTKNKLRHSPSSAVVMTYCVTTIFLTGCGRTQYKPTKAGAFPTSVHEVPVIVVPTDEQRLVGTWTEEMKEGRPGRRFDIGVPARGVLLACFANGDAHFLQAAALISLIPSASSTRRQG